MEGYIITKPSFLSCFRTQRQNHGAFNFTSLKDAILQLSCLSVYAICWCIALITRVVASLCNFYYNFGKLWCSKAHMSHNEFHCRTSIFHPFWLELLSVAPIIILAGSLIDTSISEFVLCLQTPLSLHNLKTMLQIGRYP